MCRDGVAKDLCWKIMGSYRGTARRMEAHMAGSNVLSGLRVVPI